MLAGLRDRLMAPEAAAGAMEAYAEETNRLNRERRASGATDRAELADIEKRIASMIAAIEESGYVRGMSDRLRELEARQDELNECLAAVPADLPDIHPNIAGIYRRKVERLAEAAGKPPATGTRRGRRRPGADRAHRAHPRREARARCTPPCKATSARSSNGPAQTAAGKPTAAFSAVCRSRC